MSWLVILGSFVGAGAAFVLEELGRRAVQRRLARGELARDGLHEMLSIMTALEHLLPQVASMREATSAEELADSPSAFVCAAPLISHEKYLECFDDEEVHRLILLIFERHQALMSLSERMTEAFNWLLEHPDQWQSPMGREFNGVFRRGREEALRNIQQLLQRCSELCTYLIEVRFAIFRKRSITEFIKKHYNKTTEQIREMAAYYAREDVRKPWKPEMAVLPRVFRLEHDADARGCICITYDDEEQIIGRLNRPLGIRRDEKPVQLNYSLEGSKDWLALQEPDVTAFRSYSDVETVWLKTPQLGGKGGTY